MATTAVTKSLAKLAQQINREHAAAERACADAITHAIKAGQLLAEAKEAMAHGLWLPWVGEHFAGSVRTAQLYMQLAESPNAQRVAHLSLREAARAIAAPPPASTQRELPAGGRSLSESLGRGINREEAQAALAALPPVTSEVTFPARGMQAATWHQIEQALRAAEEAMREARTAGLTAWARADTLRRASRHARDAAELLAELASTIEG